MNFSNFYFAKYKFIIELKEELILPEYKGNVLRGAFGYVFKKICCIDKNKECSGCLLKEKCVYSYIFESKLPPHSKILIKLKDIPRPFVIEPPQDKNKYYKLLDKLQFNLILIGKAIDYLPYFVFTFDELGKIGIGKKRSKYELKEVLTDKDELIYTSSDKVLRNIDAKINIKELIKINDNLTLRFITPTRIKYQNHLTKNPEFYILIRTLLQRISTLSYFYCDEELNINYKELTEKAKEVKIKHKNLKWYEFSRFSKRQSQEMKLGGFIGTITYEGPIKEFLPILLIGENIHIGKQTTFGFGKYEILKK